MIGPASQKVIDDLRDAGIDHRGLVSENEKFQLYSRSRVFAFPSINEGYSITVLETLYAGLHLVAWKIPAFLDYTQIIIQTYA